MPLRTKPRFLTQDSWKCARVSDPKWRRPKGLHSKMKNKRGGNPATPSQGYRMPANIRFFHPSGALPLVISSLKQLAHSQKRALIIASGLGLKKRLEIVKAAIAKKMKMENLPDDFVIKAEALISARKQRRTAQTTAPAQKTTAHAEPKKAEKNAEKPVQSEEDKRKENLREMEKIITKRETA